MLFERYQHKREQAFEDRLVVSVSSDLLDEFFTEMSHKKNWILDLGVFFFVIVGDLSLLKATFDDELNSYLMKGIKIYER